MVLLSMVRRVLEFSAILYACKIPRTVPILLCNALLTLVPVPSRFRFQVERVLHFLVRRRYAVTIEVVVDIGK